MFYQYNHLGSPDYIKLERHCDFSFSSHLHQCFEIVVSLSGKINVTVDNNATTLEENEALLIFPNQIHSLESTNSDIVICIFSPRLVQAYTTKVADKIPVDNKFSPDRYLVDMLKTLDTDLSFAEKKGLLYFLCGQFDKGAQYRQYHSNDQGLLYKMFRFVEEYFVGDCSLANLSKMTGYNYSYLSRYFKKSIGISFNSYVTHYRLSYACYLMSNTDLPIINCAYDSGFLSLRSFNRCFKENFEITPTQYRKNVNN